MHLTSTTTAIALRLRTASCVHSQHLKLRSSAHIADASSAIAAEPVVWTSAADELAIPRPLGSRYAISASLRRLVGDIRSLIRRPIA